MTKTKIAIIGTGSLGTALSYLILQNEYHLSIFEPNPVNLQKFLQHPKISKYKKQIQILTQDDNYLDQKFSFIIPCIPSKYIDSFYQKYLRSNNNFSYIISVSKGLYPNTTFTISQKIKSSKIIILSGPTFADEILKNTPTGCIIATKNKNIFVKVSKVFNTKNFQCYYSKEKITTELGGILKNCYAITLGIIGQNYAMNTKALTIYKILNEVKNLFQKLGFSKKETSNLSFLGDLIATGLNPNSRNTMFGSSLKYQKNTTIEGADNLDQIIKLAKKNKIQLPILIATKKYLHKPNKTTLSHLVESII